MKKYSDLSQAFSFIVKNRKIQGKDMKKLVLKFIYNFLIFAYFLMFVQTSFSKVPPFIHVLNETLTRTEFSQLPSFLQARILGGHGEYNKRQEEFKKWIALKKKWNKKIGKDYIHYHHWVLALVSFNRGLREMDPGKKKYLLKNSVGEFTYVIERVSKSNPHKYILHFFRGEALKNIGEFGQAIKDYVAAVSLNKNYLPSYLRLKEIHTQTGMHKKAKEIQNFIDKKFQK